MSYERYIESLRQIPPPGEGCHPALLAAANCGAWAGLDSDTIFADIRTHIPSGGRKVPDREIKDAVEKALRECRQGPRHSRRLTHGPPRPPPKPRFNGQQYKQILIQQGDGATEEDLKALSPVRIDWVSGPRDALCVLDSLWKPNEWLFIGNRYDTRVRHVRDIMMSIAYINGVYRPHLILNPLSGEQHMNKDGQPSFRCDAAVVSYRYALVEFDNMGHNDQVAYWHTVITQKLLPVVALVDSGGKSLHAWIRVDLPDIQAWNNVVRIGMYGDDGILSLQGADTNCQNPSRLSRLPGHFRSNTNNWQRLLYLNPR